MARGWPGVRASSVQAPGSHDPGGTVYRSSLLERLVRDDVSPVVSVVAPAGYGKTTLLAQWAERDDRVFAWVSVDEKDNDPKVLLTYLARALDAVQPVDRRLFDVLKFAGQPGTRVGRAPPGCGVHGYDHTGGAGPG